MRSEGLLEERIFQRGLMMMDVKNGADGVPTPARDAVDWFVENESDHELDEATLLQWEKWCTHVGNNAAYADIVYMRLQIPQLRAPVPASRDELLGDVDAGVGPES